MEQLDMAVTEINDVKVYDINWDAVETLDDMKQLMKEFNFSFMFHPNQPVPQELFKYLIDSETPEVVN